MSYLVYNKTFLGMEPVQYTSKCSEKSESDSTPLIRYKNAQR